MRRKFIVFKQIYYEILKLYDHLVVSEIIEDNQKKINIIEIIYFYHAVFYCANEIDLSNSKQFLFPVFNHMIVIYNDEQKIEMPVFSKLFEDCKTRDNDYLVILKNVNQKEECFIALLNYVKNKIESIKDEVRLVDELIKWQEPILNKIIEHYRVSCERIDLQ